MLSSYLNLYKTGELKKRVDAALEMLHECRVCPRNCGIDRFAGKTGFCKSGRQLIVSSYTAHHGEEPPVSGTRGSGTVFFTNCNLRCIFCQNYQISQLGEGEPCTAEELSDMMLELQKLKCHNINWVSPSHFVPQILEGLLIAAGKGLHIPVVYNSNGYDSVVTLKLLDGIVDIYLPDLKYMDDKNADECSGVSDYVKYNLPAIKEMHRQVGNLVLDGQGVAISGMIVRHLVLPGDLSNTFAALDFLSKEISPEVHISLMSQYHPCHNAEGHPVLSRRLAKEEYARAVEYAVSLGLDNCFIQAMYSSDVYLPDFKRKKPFGK